MLLRLLRRILKVAWLLPGFLLWASFPPMGEHVDSLFALAPLLWLARRGDAKRSARVWFANGLLFWFATLSWFPAIVKNGGPWPLVVLGWLGLAAYCAAYFAAFGLCAARFWRWTAGRSYAWRLAGLVLVEPILWAGLELVRSRLGGGFAWNQLGVSAVNAGFGAPSSLGGVHLVSALVVLVNGTVASIAERMLAPMTGRSVIGPYQAQEIRAPVVGGDHRAPRFLRSVETFLPLLLVYACFRLSSQPQPSTSAFLSVAMVQRNFPCCFKAQEENPSQVYSNLLSRISLLKPDLVVLPESACAEIGAVDRARAARFSEYLMRLTGAKAVLAGGNRREDGHVYNSAALYTDPSRSARDLTSTSLGVQLYDKVHLVPFGEYIPLDRTFPMLQKLAPVGSCTPGTPRLLDLPQPQPSTSTSSLPLGVAICFEDTDSALMRTYAAMGAKMLVFITNDSWFSHSNEALQHAWQATARAVETGLPVVRVGNSGVTGTILPEGKASWLFGSSGRPLVDAPGTLFDRIPLSISPSTSASDLNLTFYTRLGDVPLAVAFALLILSLIMIEYKEHYEKRRIVSLQVG